MAKHIVTLVETKELNDEQVAYCFECCGEKQHRSWLTLTLDGAENKPAIDQHMQAMAEKHERKLQWRKQAQPEKQEVTVQA